MRSPAAKCAGDKGNTMNRLKSIFTQIRITISGRVQRLVRGGHDHKGLSDNFLYAVCKYEDDTIGLTIWEEGEARTLCMSRDTAIGLIETINRYVQ